MKLKFLVILFLGLGCLSVVVAYSTNLIDGTTPPHAVDTARNPIPDSSATQPDKPIILSKDSKDPKWGELRVEAAFDHTKHNTDIKHTIDGKTLTACVECHHTEQPMPVAGKTYLKKSERGQILTAAELATSKQPVNSCRHCHFQAATAPTAEFPPKSIRYPPEMRLPPSGLLTNLVAYHTRCISCHDAAVNRDSTLKAPRECDKCHTNKLLSPTSTPAAMKSLYERLGGYDVIAAIVDDFIGRLGADPQLGKFFAGHSIDSKKRIRQHLVDQFCAAAGGPCVYVGRDTKTAHQGLGLTQAAWDVAAKHLVESLDKLKVAKVEKDELLAFVASVKKDIVEK